MDFHNLGLPQSIPVLIPAGQPQNVVRERLRAEVPPRVHLACDFLEHLARKTSAEMAGEVDRQEGFTTAKGQELSAEEVDARNAALDLISQYFNGTLKESPWDGVREQQAEKGLEVWNVIQCPACAGGHAPRGNCLLCGNTTKVRVARVQS